MNKRIRQLRKQLALTQQEFAQKIGTSQNVLANYDAGRRNPSASVVNNICKTFHVSETWLRTGGGDMYEPENTFSLDELLARCGVSNAERAVISELILAYFALKPETRLDIISQFSAKTTNAPLQSGASQENERTLPAEEERNAVLPIDPQEENA